jgi:basic amino acid/polyamine antiporter, APA family
MSAPGEQQAEQPRATLSLAAVVAIIVGIVIGAGIFRMPSLVATFSANETVFMLAWFAGGVIALVGALCYAELATAYPSAGGDYHFLSRAYGRDLSFLFGWARAIVILPGSIAFLSFLFGDYAARLFPLGEHGAAIYAALLAIALTLVNLAGIRKGSATQNWLTILEVGGVLIVIVAGLVVAAPAAAPVVAQVAPVAADKPWHAGIGMVMLFVLFTYSGWNESAYVSAEVKDAQRNMVRALVFSIVLVTVLYLLANWAYLRALGLPAMVKSQAVAADLLEKAWGTTGGVLISILVAISAITSANATIIVGARSNYALGRDWSVFSFLGRWDGTAGTPTTGLLVQGGIALALIGIGAYTRKGLETMVDYTNPVFYFFFTLVAISLIVLRVRDPGTPRPFKVPLYPLTPIILSLVTAYLLWSSVTYAKFGSLLGVGVLVAGVPILLWARSRKPVAAH